MIAKTPRSLTFFGLSPTARTERPLMTSKLKAAEPTIVDGPITGGIPSISYNVVRTDRRISGAEEPRAMRVKFATVAFHFGISIMCTCLPSLVYSYFVSVTDVIISIAL